MLSSLRHNLGSLFTFSGRSSPVQFWPYAIVVIVLGMFCLVIAMASAFAETFQRMQRFAAEHPDQVTETRGPGSYSIQIHGHHPELMPDFTALLLPVGAVAVAILILLAAAVVRRLHDTGRTGLWALPIPLCLGVGLALMPMLFGSPAGPDMGLFGLLFANNLLYLANIALLLLFLIGSGTVGANRYGPPATTG